jgi:hypothetical protein
VIGGDDERALGVFHGADDTPQAAIDRFPLQRSPRRAFLCGPPYRHSQITDDHVVLVPVDVVDQVVGNALGAHLRSEIVGRDFLRWDEDAILARVRLFNAALKK